MQKHRFYTPFFFLFCVGLWEAACQSSSKESVPAPSRQQGVATVVDSSVPASATHEEATRDEHDDELVKNPEVASKLKILEAWIETQMAYKDIAGMSVGIVYDQRLIWSRGFGYRNIEKKTPTTPDTIYRLASISKLFTATAILQLRDQGKLRLDDPVVTHLPWFKLKNPKPDAIPITVRHLLTHTSGIPRDSAASLYWDNYKFPDRHELINALTQQEPVREPEVKWNYSNLAYGVLGELIAAVSGQPYEAYVKQHILEPLGMTSTSFTLSENDKARLASGYGLKFPGQKKAKVHPDVDAQALASATGMASTVEDLARFLALQFRTDDAPKAKGAQTLRGSTLREMHRVQWLQDDWKMGRALGFEVRRLDEKSWVGHSGYFFGFRNRIDFSPVDKVGVIVLSNSDEVNPWWYMDKILHLMTPALVKAANPPKPPSSFDPSWKEYEGAYRNLWGEMQVLAINGELQIHYFVNEDPEGLVDRLTPEGKDLFRIKTASGYGVDNVRVTFLRGTGGNVVRMKFEDNSIVDKISDATQKPN